MNKKLRIPLIILLALAGTYLFYIRPQQCPTGYVNFIVNDEKMCVAKYEMKKGPDGKAISTAKGLPWTHITKDAATEACKKNGSDYDLMSNSLWTLLARDIASVPGNWSVGVSYEGKLNVGFLNREAAGPLEASEDDNQSCFGQEHACSLNNWLESRRTHRLSNRQIIWDMSGNVTELVSGVYPPFKTESDYSPLSTIDTKAEPFAIFSPSVLCETPENGCGYGSLHNPGGERKIIISRGGSWVRGSDVAGVFATEKVWTLTDTHKQLGFRCSYKPLDGIGTIDEVTEVLRGFKEEIFI